MTGCRGERKGWAEGWNVRSEDVDINLHLIIKEGNLAIMLCMGRLASMSPRLSAPLSIQASTFLLTAFVQATNTALSVVATRCVHCWSEGPLLVISSENSRCPSSSVQVRFLYCVRRPGHIS